MRFCEKYIYRKLGKYLVRSVLSIKKKKVIYPPDKMQHKIECKLS